MKIKHVKGNVLRLEIPLTIKRKGLVDGEVVENVEDFYPCSDYPTYINLKKSLTIPFEATVQDNLARMQDNGTLNVGTYQIEVMCCDEAGNPYRYMVRDIVEVVDATVDADIEAGIEFNSESYTLDAAVFTSYCIEQQIVTVLTTPLQTDKYYRLDTEIEEATFTFPSIVNTKYAKHITICFTTTEEPNIDFVASDGKEVVFSDDFSINANSSYEVTATFNGLKWIVNHTTLNQ